MHFEWDGRKNIANFRKHGVWFEETITAWQDPLAIEKFDEINSYEEDRHLLLARTSLHRILVISFTEIIGEQIIRIISARLATERERKTYEERIRLFKA